MNTIKTNFEQIVSKQKEIGFLTIEAYRPSVDYETIEKAEKMLDLKFNNELIEMYSFANGMYDKLPQFPYPLDLIPGYSFLSIESALLHCEGWILQGDYFTNLNTGKTPGKKLFPFLGNDSGDFYWVDLNVGSNEYGKIYWTNTLGEDPDYSYNSLTNFFEVTRESYESGAYFVEGDGFFDCNYDLFEQIILKYEPELPFWRNFLRKDG